MYLEQLLTFKIDKINLAWRDGSISWSDGTQNQILSMLVSPTVQVPALCKKTCVNTVSGRTEGT